MLKFIRTKNFKMPGKHRLLDVQIEKDKDGNWTQTEKWEEKVLVSTEGAEPREMSVPYTRTYHTRFDGGKMTVIENIDRSCCPPDMREDALGSEPLFWPEPTPKAKSSSSSHKSRGNIPLVVG